MAWAAGYGLGFLNGLWGRQIQIGKIFGLGIIQWTPLLEFKGQSQRDRIQGIDFKRKRVERTLDRVDSNIV